MKPWHQVIVPHEDIRKGRLDESVFAADLSDVLADRGPLEYRDPAAFFRRTYPTRGLVNLLSAMVARLAGAGRGEAVIQIQTPFGGGKTHSLIALYHLFKHGVELASSEAVGEILKKAEVKSVPPARVAAFIGTAADPLEGKTPWGEIADQLGRYAQVREHDQKRRAPGKDRLHDLLADQPTLILMDEIAEYAVKAKDYRDQVVAFFQELTEAVKVLPQCALVVTLPSSAPYGEEGERALHQLQQVFKRVETVKTPVEGEEIYEVIRRRLFDGAPDPQEARRVADAYWEMYRRLGDDVPKEVREPAYRDRICRAYPFHPELLDVLFERWSTFPDFQRTRGVLRLLAQMVAELYNGRNPDLLIQPCHVNLTNPAVRAEFLRHIGNAYQGVIASDIGGPNAKAEKIDHEMGSEYARFGIASGLARAIFFGSFSGSEKRGVSIQRLRLAVLREGIQPAIITDALRRLEEELWYLHVEGGVYSFSSQPNLNRIIVEKEEGVKDEYISDEIRSRLEKMAGSGMVVTLWPKESQDVRDDRSLKLAVLSPDYTRQASATATFAEELLRKCGQTFRVYQNTLLVLAADASESAALRLQVKRYLALRAISDDKALMRQLTDENRSWLNKRIKDAEGDIESRMLSCYRHLAKAGADGVEWFDLGLPTVGEKANLAQRVRSFLRSEELLVERLPPKRLLEKALRADEKEKPVEQIVEAFLRYPHLPMLEGEQVVREAIAQGVSDGLFGVRIGDRAYIKEPISPSAVESDAVLVREPAVPAGERPVTEPGKKEAPTFKGAPTPGPMAPSKAQPGVQTYTLRAKVPWDKLSDFYRGVVTPLQGESTELDIEVSLRARSKPGRFKQTTLEQKVKETLKQIGAEVHEESTDTE